MKFSSKEKKLFIVLGIVILAVLYFNFLLKPQLASINVIKAQISKLNSDNQNNLVAKKSLEKMDSELKILNARSKNLKATYPPVLNYDDLIIFFRAMERKSGVDIDSLNFSTIALAGQEKAGSAQKLDTGKVTDAKLKDAIASLGFEQSIINAANNGADKNAETAKAVKLPNGKAFYMGIKLTAKGSYLQIKKLISLLESQKVKLGIKDIQLSGSQGGLISAAMSVDFYGIMDNNVQDYSIIPDEAWKPLEQKNKDNIFEVYDGFPGTVSQGNGSASINNAVPSENDNKSSTNTIDFKKYDFVMSAMPFGNNLAPPSISISALNMVSPESAVGAPTVYGDNSGDEKVEVYLEEKDGKFNFKFKTESESFPTADYSKTLEFKPVGKDILFLIKSMPRKFKDDNGGAVVSLINKTSKNVIFEVYDDDAQKPRVKVVKQSGNMDVQKK